MTDPLTFKATSPWNADVRAAPLDPASGTFVKWLVDRGKATGKPYVALSGVGDGWGVPVYWASSGDPAVRVKVGSTDYGVSKLATLRIPATARPTTTSDHTLTVFDLRNGWVFDLWHASVSGGVWTAGGASLYYDTSNGLDGKLARSDDKRNFGHRGFPASHRAILRSEIANSAIPHALEVYLNQPAAKHVFPMSGHEPGRTGVIPEGARLRIKASVDVTKLGLSPAALVVAKAWQKYGLVVGDTAGSGVAHAKVQGNTDWSSILSKDAMKALTFDKFEVVKLGWGA